MRYGTSAIAPVEVDASTWPRLEALVDDVLATRREVAALQAREARLLASAVDIVADRVAEQRAAGRRSRADIPLREVSAELGTAMRLSDRAVQGRIGDASTLVARFSATLASWESGRIEAAHVGAILDAGAPIADDDARQRFEALALAVAEVETAPRLRPIAQSIAAEVDPRGAEERMTEASERRRVRVSDLGDGLARISADVPATLAHAIEDRLTQMARAVKEGGAHQASASGQCFVEPPQPRSASVSSPITVITGPAPHNADAGKGAAGGDEDATDLRSMDHLRADILCDLLLAGSPTAHGDGLAAISGRVQVTVPAATLAGGAGVPALLNGAVPIDVQTAQPLAGRSPSWDRVFTDPCDGSVLAVDRYRPSAALSRHLAARDERCRFPGCRRAAHRCDIDHTIDAALGGETRDTNLAHLCRRHHTLKHESAWTVRARGGGVIEWTSPTGRIHEDHPPASVRFVPSATAPGTTDPPPF